MSLEHLWAGWRSAYIASVSDATPGDGIDDGSLFERILLLDDAAGYVVHRAARAATVLNAYPYTNGHVLVLPVVAAAELDQLDDVTTVELWREVGDAVTAVREAYNCEGINVGMNLGGAAGAGVPDHLHVHVLPRWSGDTNFMTTIANTRVMPEPLVDSWRRLREAWPAR